MLPPKTKSSFEYSFDGINEKNNKDTRTNCEYPTTKYFPEKHHLHTNLYNKNNTRAPNQLPERAIKIMKNIITKGTRTHSFLLR